MADMYRIKPLKMLAWWIACSCFVFPVAIVTLAVAAIPVVVLLMYFVPSSNDVPFVLNLVLSSGAGAIIGLSVAFLQRWILREKLYWAADDWYRWTVLGGSLGALIVASITQVLESTTVTYLSPDMMFFMMPLFLTSVATFQVIALRRAVKQAWLWIVANLVGGVVFAGILTRNQPSYMNPNSDLLLLLIGLFAVVALGAITGTVLLFLFETKLHPMQAETDDTVETSEAQSIWDKAI